MNPLATLRLPANEFDPVELPVNVPVRVWLPVKKVAPVTLKSPAVDILPVACTPLDTSREPENELEPVFELVIVPVIKALPLTVKLVPTIAWALSPLEMRRLPEKELELTPVEIN